MSTTVTSMKHQTLIVYLIALFAFAFADDAWAQSFRWAPYVALPSRATALEIIDDSTTLVGLLEGTDRPSLAMIRGDSIYWTMRMDTSKLPYFEYPHGRLSPSDVQTRTRPAKLPSHRPPLEAPT